MATRRQRLCRLRWAGSHHLGGGSGPPGRHNPEVGIRGLCRWYVMCFLHTVRKCMCQSHTKWKALPASIGLGFLGLQQDDLGLQTDHLCQQRLLIVGECAASLALSVQFHLH